MPKSHPIPTLAALALTLLTATARPQSLPATTPALPNLPPNTPPPHWPVAQYRALLAPHDPTPEQKAQTTRLINDLTADDYPTRQRASKELATRGPDAFPGLRQAVANSNSAELEARTAEAIAANPFEIPPDLPQGVRDMVRRYIDVRAKYVASAARNPNWPSDAVLSGLYELRTDQADLFFRIILPQETDARMRAPLDNALADRAPFNARLAIAQGKLDDAQHILLTAPRPGDSINDYVTLRILRAGPSLDPEKEAALLPPNTPNPNLIKARFYLAAGNLPHAAQLARPSSDDTFNTARRILIQAGMYSELAAYIEGAPRHRPDDTAAILPYLLAGNSQHARDLLDNLLQTYGDKQFKTTGGIRLVQADRAADGIALALRTGQSDTAFDLLCDQLRIREALAAIPDRSTASVFLPLHLAQLGLPDAARNLLKDIQPEAPARFGTSRSYFLYASACDILGEQPQAQQWRDRGFEFATPIAQQVAAAHEQLNQYFDAQQRVDQRTNPRDYDRLRLLVSNQQKFLLENETLAADISFLELDFPNTQQATDASYWYGDILKPLTPDLRQRYQQTLRILHGQISDQEIGPLMDAVVNAAKPRGYGLPTAYLDAAISVFHQMHHDDWAQTLTDRCFAAYHDPTCFIPLGDLALQNNDPRRAADLYQRAAVLNITDPALMYRLGLALSRTPDTRSDGQQLLADVPLLVLSDRDKALAVADVIRRFQTTADADAWLQAFARRGAFHLYDIGDFLATDRDTAEARGDFTTALTLQKQILFGPEHPRDRRYSVPSLYMLAFAHYHRLRALDALARHDFPTLTDALNRSLDDGPPDIPLLQKALPALHAADPAAAAILTRAHDRLAPILHDYPTAEPYRTQLQTLATILPTP